MSQVSANAASATAGASAVHRGSGGRGADASGAADGSDAFMLAFSAAEADEGPKGSATPPSAPAADPLDAATPADGSAAPAADASASTGTGGVDHGLLLAQSALLGIDLGAPTAAAAAAAAASSAGASSTAANASATSATSASSIAAIGLASGSAASATGATAGAAAALADPSKAAGTATDAGSDAAQAAAADTSGEAAVAPRGTRSISDRTTSRLGVDDPTSQQRVRALGIEPDATRATGESLFGRSAAHAGSGAGAGNGSNGSAGNGLQAQAAAAQRLAAQDDRQPAATGAAPIGGAAVVPDSTALQVATAMEAMPRRIEGAKADAPSIRGAEPGSVSAAPSASPFMLPVDAAAAGASASHLEMAQRMVEQVSWWLSQKTQGAELKLEVMGGHRVSVSVQVQGNEAQVAFRSDHPETRHMLQQAMPQLKELLGNEGLMLANSSVGGEAQGAGQPSDGQGARQFQGREGGSDAAPGAAEAPKPAHRVQSSRALDMYV